MISVDTNGELLPAARITRHDHTILPVFPGRAIPEEVYFMRIIVGG